MEGCGVEIFQGLVQCPAGVLEVFQGQVRCPAVVLKFFRVLFIVRLWCWSFSIQVDLEVHKI